MPRRKTEEQKQESTPQQVQQSAQQGGISLCDSPVDELEGVGRETAAKLHAIGVYTVRDLAFMSKPDLREAGIDDARASSLIRRALKECGMLNIMPADVLNAQLVSAKKLTTLSGNLDDLLNGGLQVGNMYELIGEFGTGKTQMCFQLSIAATLPEDAHGLDGSVLFLDSEHTFKPGRIEQIARNRGLDPSTVLSRIYVAPIYTPDHLELLLKDTIPTYIRQHNIKLIVIDSLIKLYRAAMPGRENLAERQQRLNQVLARLSNMADRYGLIVVFTNQVVANPVPFTSEPMRPAGGNIVAHAAQYRIELVRKGKVRMARVIDSADIPADKYTCFTITAAGIEDAPCT